MPDEWRYSVTVARLPGDLPAVHDVRRQVFIVEQGIPADLEWDGQDSACHHVLATDLRQAAVGTGRLDPEGRIGRMAVLPGWRSHGVGRALLAALFDIARARGHMKVVVNAQCIVSGFYRKAGFRELGQPFIEAGIKHVKMIYTFVSGNND